MQLFSFFIKLSGSIISGCITLPSSFAKTKLEKPNDNNKTEKYVVIVLKFNIKTSPLENTRLISLIDIFLKNFSNNKEHLFIKDLI